MKKKIILIITVFLMTFGLYAQSPKRGQSEIIVKRASSSINAGVRAQVYIDGYNKLNLTNGMEGKIIVSDGDYVIFAKMGFLTSNEVRFTVRSGSVTFTLTPHSSDQLVIEQQGRSSATSSSTTNTASANMPATTNNSSGVEGALKRAADQIAEKLPRDSLIAIMSVVAEDSDIAEFIAGDLEAILSNLSNKNIKVVDRNQLDELRKERDFQYSGEADDASAISIGKYLGANVIITGSVTGGGNLRRLRLRALDTQTAQVLGSVAEPF
ncbi:MAG: CsgG/HfaB family protein [Treponema sp.]|nr:CsgG/HfaB family protein [Treponema sp.]